MGEAQDDIKTALNAPIGLQFWSVREYLPKDLPGVLKKVRGMGFREVEGAGVSRISSAANRSGASVRFACCLGLAAAVWVVETATLRPYFAERLVYIGTYTGRPGLPSKGIYAFRFDDTSGALSPVGLVAETPSPSFLISSGNSRFVFAVNELQSFDGEANSGSVTSFTVDPATSKLAEINVQPTKGAGPCHLALDRTGRYLAVANYGGGNYSLFPVAVDGRLQPPTAVVTGERTEAKPLGHMVAFDADNRFLVTADKGLNRMLVFRFDALMGSLTPNDPPSAPLPPGSGPRHFAFHPNGRWVFTINEQGATITTFSWDSKAGTLKPTSSVATRPAEVTTGSTAEIAVHPTGSFVYGSNRGHDTIAVFSVDGNGVLTLVEYEPTRGRTPRNFAIDPTGRWLIAANERSDTLAVFSIDQTNGALSPVGPLASVGAPVSILFME